MWNWIRKTLLAGFVVLTPIILTIYLLALLFHLLDGILKNSVVRFLLEHVGLAHLKVPIPGLGVLLILLILFLTGIIARNYFGKKLIELGNLIVTRIPLINRIYIAIREIIEAILSEKREVLKKAVLIEYPRKGLYSIAFFTQDTKGPVQDTLDKDVISVFLPTTPNPTSGYLLFVPKKDVIELEMPVEDALKLVISGGSIHLNKHRNIATPIWSRRKSKGAK